MSRDSSPYAKAGDYDARGLLTREGFDRQRQAAMHPPPLDDVERVAMAIRHAARLYVEFKIPPDMSWGSYCELTRDMARAAIAAQQQRPDKAEG